MQNKKLFVVLTAVSLLLMISPVLAAIKVKLTKAVITQINDFTLTAIKNEKTYNINAQKAILKNATGKRATIDQFFTGDQIDVNGTMGADGIIIAKTIKDRSLKGTDLTRRNVGPDNLQAGAISDLSFISNGVITEDKIKAGTLTNASIADSANISASKLNLTNAIIGADIQNGTITSDKLADGITLTTGNISTLDLGTNTIIDGNLNGNWNFNSGNLSGVGTIGSGDITTSGTVTANGTGNNYFAGNVGIGTTGSIYPLDVFGTIGNNGYRAITIPNQTVIGISTTGTETGFNLGLLNYNLFIGDGGTLNTVAIGAGNPIDPLSFEAAGLVNGLYNTFAGMSAGLGNTTGNFNTFLGSMAGQNNANGDQNTFIGAVAGQLNTSGYRNTYIGVGAGQSSNGFINTYIGTDNHLLATSGSYNTSVGNGAGLNAPGSYNSDFGFQALQYTTANYNSAFGVNSLNNDTSGSNNVAMGYYAGATLTEGSNNTFIGNQSDVASAVAATLTNSTAIGNGVVATKSNQVILGNTSVIETLLNGNVGIGVTPTQKFEITSGNIQIPNNYGLLGRSSDTTSVNLIGVNGSNEVIIGSGNKYVGLTFSTGGTNGGNMVRFTNGNVGIGTTAPQSKLQVDGGYMQLDNNSGAPTTGDCDAAAEEGRLYWDATADEFYICSGVSGWRKVTTVAP